MALNINAAPFIPAATTALVAAPKTVSETGLRSLGDDLLKHILGSLGDENLALILTRIPDPDKSMLEYPFSFILRGSSSPDDDDDDGFESYYLNDFARGLLDEEKCDCGNFPNNISEYYWIHEGKNDDESWLCLCRLDNGCYAFYSASCDYTGFGCQGGMTLIVSKDIKKLFYEGLHDKYRNMCIADKKAGLSCVPYKAPVDPGWPIPVPPKPNTVNPTKAFIRVWVDGKELILNLDHMNGLEMDELEYAIGGLTAQFLTPKPATSAAGSSAAGSSAAGSSAAGSSAAGSSAATRSSAATSSNKGPKPKKKFYRVAICTSTSVLGIDDYFKKRFGNPNKKWELRMNSGVSGRKWGKVEVSFILY
jgi:hypothetical protein